MGKTGWYDGFAITVDQVTATPGFGDGADIEINVTYVNLGTEADTPRGGAAEVDGAIADAFFDSPQIPGEGKAKGTIEFSLIPDRDQSITLEEAIDKVVLVYGEAGDNQTKIPLAAAGKVESIEPKTLTAGGTLAQGPINIEVVSGTLVPSYETGEEGKALLNLRIKLTCLPGCSASGYNTGFEEFSVTGPDGSSVTADDRSLYCCDALYPETVSDDARNILTFVVALPGTGAYKLTYSNPSLTAAGTAPATLDLTA